MFGLGPTELIVILVLALLVLGPNRIPEAAASLGKAIRSFRKATRDLRDQIEVEDHIRQPLEDLRSALRDEPPPSRFYESINQPPTPAAAGLMTPALPPAEPPVVAPPTATAGIPEATPAVASAGAPAAAPAAPVVPAAAPVPPAAPLAAETAKG